MLFSLEKEPFYFLQYANIQLSEVSTYEWKGQATWNIYVQVLFCWNKSRLQTCAVPSLWPVREESKVPSPASHTHTHPAYSAGSIASLCNFHSFKSCVAASHCGFKKLHFPDVWQSQEVLGAHLPHIIFPSVVCPFKSFAPLKKKAQSQLSLLEFIMF